MKNVTFITTGQPTTNPRLVKEAETLYANGYQVKVICCFYQTWATPFDQRIIERNPGMFVFCGGDPVSRKWTFLKTRIRQKICQQLFKYFKVSGIAENAISRTHAESLSIAKNITTDLYIAHNLGALPAAVLAAKYNQSKVGYDAEDMHSGQFDSMFDNMYLINKYIETKYFERINYFTAASPLIAENYKRLYKYLSPLVINNVFHKTHFPRKIRKVNRRELTLFWFSQTIGANRGIENIIKAIAEINNVHLHLLGNCMVEEKTRMLTLALDCGLDENRIHFHAPVHPDDLMDFAALFDIGMATETGTTLNRDICLTNKIFTYIQAGLAVIASDTQAQQLFFEQNPQCGLLFLKDNSLSLINAIKKYAEDIGFLQDTQQWNFDLGQTKLNWETESNRFIELIQTITADE